MLRRSAVVAVLALAGLALPGSASAQTPVTGGFTDTEINVDPGVSATCGFTVTETDTTTGRFELFFDNSGTPIRLQVEDHYTGFVSANGLSVDTAGAGVGIFDLANGGETNAGINIRVSLPGGGVLYIYRGRLVSTAMAIRDPTGDDEVVAIGDADSQNLAAIWLVASFSVTSLVVPNTCPRQHPPPLPTRCRR